MITRAISSAARLPLAPAKLATQMAGAFLRGMRGETPGRTSSARTSGGTSSTRRSGSKPARRSRAQAQSKRSATRGSGTQQTKRRNKQPKRTTTRAQSKGRSSAARSKRTGARTSAQARPKSAERTEPPSDVIIAREVESTIFRDIEADRGQVDVDVAEGVVRLRGEVPTPDRMNELEGRASRVPQVRRVENLLRTPAPAPEPATPEAQQADPAAAGTVLLAPDGPERRGDDPGPPTGRPEDALEPAGRPGGDGSAGQNEPGNAGPGNDRSH